jgi:hypothetical protein
MIEKALVSAKSVKPRSKVKTWNTFRKCTIRRSKSIMQQSLPRKMLLNLKKSEKSSRKQPKLLRWSKPELQQDSQLQPKEQLWLDRVLLHQKFQARGNLLQSLLLNSRLRKEQSTQKTWTFKKMVFQKNTFHYGNRFKCRSSLDLRIMRWIIFFFRITQVQLKLKNQRNQCRRNSKQRKEVS